MSAMTAASRGRDRWLRLKRIWRRFVDQIGILLYGFALALVVMSGWAAYASVIETGWGANAAAWVQAAGTIAAIAGAAWVAQSEVRRARRVRREQNEEAAWHVRYTLVQAQFEAQIVAAELLNRDKPIEESDVREWKQRVMTSLVSLTAFIARTDHIHPSVTHVLSNAKVLIEDLVTDLGTLAELVRAGKAADKKLTGLIVSPHWALLTIVKNFDERMRLVRDALDEGNDGLPIRTWPDWTDVEISSLESREIADKKEPGS